MPVPLSERLDALARERTGILDALERMDADARQTRPAPDRWSPIEIGEHVYRAEHAVLRGVEQQLAAGEARRDVGKPRPGAMVLLLAAMRSPKRLQMPEGARGIAPEGMAYEALREAWDGLAARWSAAASLPDALEETPIVRHPVAGPLTLGDAVRFLTAHASRHRRQLARANRH